MLPGWLAVVLLAGCAPGSAPDLGKDVEDTGTPSTDGDDTSADSAGDSARDTSGDSAPPPSDLDGDGYTTEGGDCDDADDGVHPGAPEDCATEADDDCDGDTDDVDALGCQDFHVDADGDGHGGDATACVCTASVGYVTTGDDCDDTRATVAPGLEEVCRDHLDNDCDGGAPACVLADLDLSAADARYTGEDRDDRAGYLALAPDVDGDGLDDLLVGALAHGVSAYDQGSVYLVLGSATPASGSLAGAAARFDGVAQSSHTGSALAGLGDVDGDGLGDMLFGAPYVDDDMGAAYLVLGAASPASGSLSTADATFLGAATYDDAGWSVSAAGDVDGDGLADLLIGAPFANTDDGSVGAAYLLTGSASLAGGTLGEVGVAMAGTASADQAGSSVAGAGDVDGDGHDDMLVGAVGTDTVAEDAGAVYLILGSGAPAEVELAAADATFDGTRRSEEAGTSVCGAGDTNADGYADFLVGSPAYPLGGRVYLVFGSASPADASLADADAILGSTSTNGEAGVSVATAGDVDGDGHDDLFIGDDGYWSSDEGTAYVVSGASAAGALTLGTGDVSLVAEDVGDYGGISVAGGRDVNGDGYPDLAVGAIGNDAAGSMAGAAYLVLGTGL